MSKSSPATAGIARRSPHKSPTPSLKSPTPTHKSPTPTLKSPTPPVSKEANSPPRSRGSSTSTSAPSNEAGDGDLRKELEALRERLAEAETQVSSLELKEFSSSEEITKLKEKLSTVRADILHGFDAVSLICGCTIYVEYSIVRVYRSKRPELS